MDIDRLSRMSVGWLARGFGTALGAVGPESILATIAIMMFSTKYFFPKVCASSRACPLFLDLRERDCQDPPPPELFRGTSLVR